MTLGEGRRKVLMLIDEYSSGGAITEDKDINLKMIDFFDQAQRHVAKYKKIVREYEVPLEAGVERYGMPEDFGGLFRVWRDGRLTRKYAWRGKSVVIPEGDARAVTVEYFAEPAAIPFDAKDDYVFEVDEDAAACMPYFVAAQQLIVDLILDPAPLLELYERMLAALDTRRPEAGGGGVRQALYR